MTAADELERMAGEFVERAERHEALERQFRKDGDDVNATDQDGKCAAFVEAAERLRERVAEIRAADSAHPPSLPKPKRVEPDQWWTHKPSGHIHWQPFRILDEEAAEASQDMLTDPDALYLGNAERPNIGGSEVAGEVER